MERKWHPLGPALEERPEAIGTCEGSSREMLLWSQTCREPARGYLFYPKQNFKTLH